MVEDDTAAGADEEDDTAAEADDASAEDGTAAEGIPDGESGEVEG